MALRRLLNPIHLKCARQGLKSPKRFLTIPVNQVARVMRITVAGEEEAEQADKIVKDMLPELQSFDGFSTVTRHVCKAEWAYEVSIVFDGLDNFKSFMDSDKREESIAKNMEDIEKLAVDSKVYSGNRVHDNF